MSQPRPRLTVLQVSDSFATLWSGLAEQGGYELTLSQGGEPRGDVVIVNLAGREDRVAAALAGLGEVCSRILVIGSVPDYRVAVAALRHGASEYLSLPQDLGAVGQWLADQAAGIRAEQRNATFTTGEAAKYRFEGILGHSPALRDSLERAARIIPHPGVTVLIHGETGTGKELLARAIHYNGPRRGAPFVDVNCAAIPEQLLESELFGHEKGAFTDASATKPGLFEVAHGGTLFLDEIGHLSLLLQGKLLRVLEQREIRRVGGTATIPVDVRVIAATHVNLTEAAARGEFREDLYYRLNVVGLRLPALRERAGDVALLARHFLDRFARDYGLPEVRLTARAERRLATHPWSGNVRELRNVLERAVLLAGGERIDADDLGLDTGIASPATGGVPFPATMSEVIRGAAQTMIRLCDGNKSEAARRLAISRTRLLRLIAPRRRPALLEEES